MPTPERQILASFTLSLAALCGGAATPAGDPVTAVLESRAWSVASYLDGHSLVAPANDANTSPRLTFSNGAIAGTAGCGGLSGSYRRSDGHLLLQTGYLLGGFCPEASIRQADLICNALSGDRLLETDGERITLRDEHGTTQIVLKR